MPTAMTRKKLFSFPKLKHDRMMLITQRVAAILRTPSLRSPSSIFLCSLAVSDFLVGLVVQPAYIANELIANEPGSSLSHAGSLLSLSVRGVSLCTMTAISVDRFLAIHYHMRHPNMVTEK